MSSLRLLLRWTRVQNKIFWRTPIGAFFSLVFPVVMIVMFATVFGNQKFDTDYGKISPSQFYVVGLATFSAVSSTYTHITVNLSNRREQGILKRVRGTPLPRWIYLGSIALSSVWLAALGVLLMFGLGVVAYDVTIELAKVPAIIVTFIVGSATFAVLGVAMSSLARSVSAAVPLANATLLPLAFISDVFVPFGEDAPGWLVTASDLFPLKHFAASLGEALSPFSEAPAFQWQRYGVMLLWMAAGAVVIVRRFRWEMPEASSRRSGGALGGHSAQ